MYFYVTYNTQMTYSKSEMSIGSHDRTENCIIGFDVLHSFNFQHSLVAGLQVQRHCGDDPEECGPEDAFHLDMKTSM